MSNIYSLRCQTHRITICILVCLRNKLCMFFLKASRRFWIHSWELLFDRWGVSRWSSAAALRLLETHPWEDALFFLSPSYKGWCTLSNCRLNSNCFPLLSRESAFFISLTTQALLPGLALFSSRLCWSAASRTTVMLEGSDDFLDYT